MARFQAVTSETVVALVHFLSTTPAKTNWIPINIAVSVFNCSANNLLASLNSLLVVASYSMVCLSAVAAIAKCSSAVMTPVIAFA
eukprot:1476658-Ditylum_brightwellii.AAC.1